MSVLQYKRTLSKTEYLKKIYDLNIRCGQIVMNKSKKYRPNYGDFLIQECLEMLKLGQMANSVYLTATTSDVEKKLRKECLHKILGIAENVSTTADIFLDLTVESDGREKVDKQKMEFAAYCTDIINLVKGVIKHDKQFK